MPRGRSAGVLVTIALVVAMAIVGCAGAPSAQPSTLRVFATTSLRSAFRRIGAVFERAYPGTRVEFNFAGSATLARQIEQGAIFDVFASADMPSMQRIAPLVAQPIVFAHNSLEIVVPAGNPGHITGLHDLTKPGLKIALCAPAVPAGRYAAQAFANSGLAVPEASQEPNVKAVITKVALGEADAGVAYVTDVRAGGAQIAGVPIPGNLNVVASYPIAVAARPPAPAHARDFAAFVLGSNAQDILAGAGFLPP